jgi:two-component system sensor histidine kinase SenX3
VKTPWSARRTESAGDIDRVRRSEAEAARARDQLRQAVQALPGGVVLFDSDGREVLRNDTARRLGGGHARVLLDEAVERLAHSDDASATQSVDLFGPPRTVILLHRHQLDDGTMITIEDVSERVRTDAMRTDFVANMSHELKTPLGAMALLAETISESDDPEVVQRFSSRLVEEAHRVARTVDELLELSNVEHGDEPRHEPVSLAGAIHEAVDRTKVLAHRHEVHVAVEIPIDVDVMGSQRQLASAVTNLVENAIKYSDPRSPVEVVLAADGEVATVQVVDHGIGVPLREQERIFERFYRVDRARSRATGGTGLGLAIVRHIAQRHGGSVSVASREGEGSVFTLTIPRGGA